MEGVSGEEQPVDEFYRLRLLRVHDKVAVRPAIVAEEMLERHTDLAVSKPLTMPPGRVLRDGPAFFLGQGTHDGDEQLALGIEGPDVFLLKVHLDAVILELPDGCQAVDRIPGETADGFRNDEVDFARQRVPDHRIEPFTMFRIRRRDTFVRVHPCELPVIPALYIMSIIVDLRLVARHLIGMVRRYTGVAGDFPFLLTVDRRCCVPADRRRYGPYSSLHDVVPSFSSSPPSGLPVPSVSKDGLFSLLYMPV